MRAVAQNSHAIAHPTWLDMQSVTRFSVGMITDSISSASSRRMSNFRVPSDERETNDDTGCPIVKFCFR